MAFTPDACRVALAAALGTVPGIGVVHEYRRIVRDEQSARTHLFDGTRINGWMIAPAGTNTSVNTRQPGFQAIGTQGGGQMLTTFQFQVEAYYGLDDPGASEKTFMDLAWAAVLHLNRFGALPISGIVHQLPADLEQFGYAMFANFYLVHYARIGIGFQGKTI